MPANSAFALLLLDAIVPALYKSPRLLLFNKDDNINNSEALKRYDRQKLTLVECQN